MASLPPLVTEVKHRHLEPKSTRNPKTKSSSLKHKTRSPSDAVRQSEQSLNQLLEDFEEGRLNAFGNSDMLQKMNEIREMQARLTLKHFEIDQMRMSQANKAGTSEDKDDSSLHELTQALERLGNAIQSLHSNDSKRRPETRKRVSIHPDDDTVPIEGRVTPL